jgi:hypothetical protein
MINHGKSIEFVDGGKNQTRGDEYESRFKVGKQDAIVTKFV